MDNSEDIKRVGCLTDEQNEYYLKLTPKQRAYVNYRGQGYGKTIAYKMAGYGGKNIGQAAYNLETKNRGIAEIIQAFLSIRKAREITEDGSALNNKIDALALQDGADKIIRAVEGADGETAKRIQFFRDIISGKIKTIKQIKKYNCEGMLIETKVEEVSDINVKITARKELDKLLGLNQFIDMGKLQMGNITINIVDASKKEELEDERNKVQLNENDVKIVDGDECIVQEEEIEKINTKKTKIVDGDD